MDTTAIPTQMTVSRPKYTCLCKEGYYIPNETLQGFPSDKVESDTYGGSNFSCLRCPGDCFSCDKDGVCTHGPEEHDDFLSTESVVRVSIGAIIGACVICCFLLGLTVFRQRKCKVSKATAS
jgi:G protein-coupled receptor 158